MDNGEAVLSPPLIGFKPAMAGRAFKFVARVVYHSCRRQVRVVMSFPLDRRYNVVIG